jgi:hypothetical protein
MTPSRGAVLALLSCVLSGAAITAYSQDPGEETAGGAAAGQEIPCSKPVNLQVLPKDMSSASVGKLMKRIAQDRDPKEKVPSTSPAWTGSSSRARTRTSRARWCSLLEGVDLAPDVTLSRVLKLEREAAELRYLRVH